MSFRGALWKSTICLTPYFVIIEVIVSKNILKKNPCLLDTHKFDCPLFLLWHYHTHFIGMTVLHNCFHKSHCFKNYYNYLVSIDWIWWCPLSLVASSYIPTLFFILLGWLTSILPVKCINFPLSDSESLLWQWSTRVKPGT